MKIIKNLSKANIRNYEGFEVREDLNFSDDGNYFRGFSYKGMPITTLRSDNVTYLSIRVDYLNNEFTYKEWMNTEEYHLTDEFNGVPEFDMDKLIENLERVIAKVAEMNEAARNEEIDMTEVKNVLVQEIAYAEQVVEDFKKNFKWYEVSEYKLKTLVAYMKEQVKGIERAKELISKLDTCDRRHKKEYVERLKAYGYVQIAKDGFYLRELVNALNNN